MRLFKLACNGVPNVSSGGGGGWNCKQHLHTPIHACVSIKKDAKKLTNWQTAWTGGRERFRRIATMATTTHNTRRSHFLLLLRCYAARLLVRCSDSHCWQWMPSGDCAGGGGGVGGSGALTAIGRASAPYKYIGGDTRKLPWTQKWTH